MNKKNAELLDGFKYYLETAITAKGRKRAANTVTNTYGDVYNFLTFIGGLDAECATYIVATEWISSLGDTSAATRNRKKSSIRALYEYMITTNMIEKNPLQALKPEKISKGEYGNQVTRDWLEVDEIKRFKSVLDREAKLPTHKSNVLMENVKVNNLRWRAMLNLMLETGIRVNEAITLERAELRNDPTKGYFIIILPEKSKNGEMRKIPVPKYVVDYIKEYRNAIQFNPDNNYVFLSQNGNKLTQNDVNKKVKEYAKMANVEKNLTPHSLRHTFASYKLNVEHIPSTVVAKWMGHDSKILEKIYFHQEEMEGECVI